METMTFDRTPQTIALNAQLEIVRVDDLEFNTPKGRASVRGWALRIPGRGFIRFKHDTDMLPYTPGRDALQKIIDDGGFIEYDSLAFVNPMTYGERLLAQYTEMKRKHPDSVLLFRTDDFYETFADDAIVVSEIISNLVLTRRPNGNGYIYIAGFPHHALDSYLPKIVRAGKRVAICEQLEKPERYCKRGIASIK